MNAILAVLITCACCLGTGGFSFDSHVGVVDAKEGRLCLNILNPHLSNGTAVSFILPHKPQRVAGAVIEEKVAQSCSASPGTDPNASFYWLKLVGKHQTVNLSEPLPPAIGIIDAKKSVFVRQGIASGDLDGDGTAEFFRICTSSEGNHLTVWSGKPLQGKKRWHSYYYLGYDVVPTCKKRDFD
jgi:hypothetical protein